MVIFFSPLTGDMVRVDVGGEHRSETEFISDMH